MEGDGGTDFGGFEIVTDFDEDELGVNEAPPAEPGASMLDAYPEERQKTILDYYGLSKEEFDSPQFTDDERQEMIDCAKV